MARPRSVLLPEYAGTGRAVIEPSGTRVAGIHLPERAVLCFFMNVIKEMEKRKEITVIHHLTTETGLLPIYALGKGKDRIALYHPGIGAPFAAASLEEMISYGSKYVIACGGAGVLRKDLPVGTIIIPTTAIRDEGTSYHYQPRNRVVKPHPDAVKAIKLACERHGTHFETGPTWTTDGFYRETPRKIAARRRAGCLTVEMEAAAFFAVASFRKIKFGQILYAGDDVSGTEWDTRRSNNRASAREKLLMLAIEAVRMMK
jgi:uridine phosphorylase